ncbi:hypothetical protein EMPG_13813 [Blastomyces silverae]|uniref:Zn(2)-C6 fungal-type domain-containing protein n=1 Tax=Blastomyces silverae TaxID=2060906 RepID=A0A0H1BIH1_9EURO|nr:hypothetical protein EMPG_13813 [Blastomyces silverae]
MSPTPPSTTSSSIGAHSPEGQYRVVRKRNRVPVSCAPCRSRKLKCNRGMPCENCVKRSDAPSCTYAQPKTRKKPVSNQDSPVSPDGMQSRIDRLESLVLSLMTNGSQSAGPTAAHAAISADSTSSASRQDTQELIGDEMDDGEEESDTEQVTKSFGVMKVDTKTQKTYYVSEAHWMMVLNDISEVKQYFITHKKQYEEHIEKIQAANNEPHFAAPPLLFGAMKPPSEKEILSNFPSRYTTDMLINRYFEHYDPFTRKPLIPVKITSDALANLHPDIIHVPSFKREYERHWEDPSKSSLVWMGMVFAMLRLACLTYHGRSDEPPEFRGKSLHLASTYRNSMAQCLVVADYTKPHCYLIEALVLHLHGDYSQVNESEVSVWVLIGVIVRLAMRMGYHRDAKMFPNISPFQGEMRRRLWAFIRQADLLLSFQVGLPSMIRTGDCDTELPRNLYDADFDEDSVKLRPERPIDEPAPISFLIVKARGAIAFGRVLETTQKVTGCSYEEVMDLDHQLRQVRDMIPERMGVKPLEECNESPYFIKARFVIVSIYHKAQCVLHRRFLNRGRENPRYAYSRRACIDSAMELLRFQNMLQTPPRTDNRFQHTVGYITTTSTHDFLMAGTILALDIYQQIQERTRTAGRTSTDSFASGMARYQEELAMLRKSRDIWNEVKDRSVDAWRATAIMDVMLGKLFPSQSQQEQNRSAPFTMAGPSTAPTTEGRPFEPQDEKENAAITLGLLSTGINQMGSTGSPQFGDADPMKFDASSGFGSGGNQGGMIDPTQLPTPGGIGIFGQMPPMPGYNLDWDTWDSYVQTATADSNNQNWPMFDMQGFSPGALHPSPTPPPPAATLPQPHQSHLSHQQPQEEQTGPETTGGKRVFSMHHNIFDAGGRD